MKPYNVEIFTPTFQMVGNTNIDEVTYKEDYLSGDENTITVLPINGVSKQDYIRISRGNEEYAGVITEITYGTDKSKNLMQISYKPFVEINNDNINEIEFLTLMTDIDKYCELNTDEFYAYGSATEAWSYMDYEICMDEDIDVSCLEKALSLAYERFPYFNTNSTFAGRLPVLSIQNA